MFKKKKKEEAGPTGEGDWCVYGKVEGRVFLTLSAFIANNERNEKFTQHNENITFL